MRTRVGLGSSRTLFLLLCLVLAIDLSLIAADILHRNAVLSDTRFLVTRDRRFAEMFQYLKAGAAAALIGFVAVRDRSRTALLWASFLTFIALDKWLMLHQRAGALLATALQLPAIGSARANHLGELMFYGFIGSATLAAIAWTWLHGDARDRRITSTLVWSVGALAVCTVGFDAVSSLTHGTAAAPVFAVVADGGEMIALTAVLFTVIAVTSDIALHSRPAERFRDYGATRFDDAAIDARHASLRFVRRGRTRTPQ